MSFESLYRIVTFSCSPTFFQSSGNVVCHITRTSYSQAEPPSTLHRLGHLVAKAMVRSLLPHPNNQGALGKVRIGERERTKRIHGYKAVPAAYRSDCTLKLKLLVEWPQSELQCLEDKDATTKDSREKITRNSAQSPRRRSWIGAHGSDDGSDFAAHWRCMS